MYWIIIFSIAIGIAYNYNPYIAISLVILLIPTFLHRLIDMLLSFITKKEYLINHHVGIADERKLVYEYLNIQDKKANKDEKIESYNHTLKNINAMYNDIKVNFKNVSNFQQSGDFYYAQNITKINLSLRPLEVPLLTFSFLINGFGERYLRSLIMIILTLCLIGSMQKPNIDYISTPATPSFLLDVKYDKISNFNVTGYTISDFLLISKVIDYDNKDTNSMNESFPAYDNRFDFKYNEQKVPKIKEDSFWVKFYYATSHITAPFTQENKKWFQNMSEKSHSISFALTIFIWLCFVGMITAIFNRIRR